MSRGSVTILMIAASVHAQLSLTPTRIFWSADQIVRTTDGEDGARVLVSQALEEHVRTFPNKTTMVIGGQIREHWLPSIDGAHFQRLNDDEARTHLAQCGRVLFIGSVKVDGDRATVSVGEGNRCSASGMDVRFRHSVDGWQLQRDGVQGGFVSSLGHCGCPAI